MKDSQDVAGQCYMVQNSNIRIKALVECFGFSLENGKIGLGILSRVGQILVVLNKEFDNLGTYKVDTVGIFVVRILKLSF